MEKEEKFNCPWRPEVVMNTYESDSAPNRCGRGVNCEYYRFDFTDGVSRCKYQDNSPFGGPCYYG
jgi:hypothetical protein